MLVQHVNMSVHLTSFQFCVCCCFFFLFYFCFVCLLSFCNVIWRCAPIEGKRKSKQVQISLDKQFFLSFFHLFGLDSMVHLMHTKRSKAWVSKAREKKKPSHVKPITVIGVFSVCFYSDLSMPHVHFYLCVNRAVSGVFAERNRRRRRKKQNKSMFCRRREEAKPKI